MTVCDSLGPFADGDVDPAEAAAFRAHLPECETCREDLRKTMRLIALLSMSPLTETVVVTKQHPDFWWRWSWWRMRWEVHTNAEYTFREAGYQYGLESDDELEDGGTRHPAPRKPFLRWRKP